MQLAINDVLEKYKVKVAEMAHDLILLETQCEQLLKENENLQTQINTLNNELEQLRNNEKAIVKPMEAKSNEKSNAKVS